MQICSKWKKEIEYRLNYIIPSHIMFPEKEFLKEVIGREAKLCVIFFPDKNLWRMCNTYATLPHSLELPLNKTLL